MLDRAGPSECLSGGCTGARIGPNAILQLRGPVAEMLGPDALAEVLHISGVPMPAGDEMIPQEHVARVHVTLRRRYPGQMRAIAEASGRATARYIRANRIPPVARAMLGVLPRALAERLLTRAIVAHAWTFCGSGSVTAARRAGGIEIAVAGNPMVDPMSSEPAQCHWHSAVFAELYATLIGAAYDARETACCGAGARACRFVIRRGG